MIDLDAARAWLRDHLPEGESIVFSDEAAIERAAAVVRALPTEQTEAA